MHESLFEMMTGIGWQVDYKPNITRDEIKALHTGYDGLIVRSKTTIDRDLLGDAPTLKLVGRAGAGLDNVDLAYMEEKGIHVLHASEGNRDAVGEYAVGTLLSLLRNIPRGDQQVRQSVWDREGNRGEEIMGKTIGIVGYGNMGHAFARRLSGFGCNVLAYDKYKTGFTDAFVREVSMETLWSESDMLSLHIPLTAETRMMVNGEYLKRFKKRIVFVNTARGEIVSLTDLAEAVEQGQVRGAVLDVLENEKLDKLTASQRHAFNLLANRSNVILTPHIAGWTFESHVKINVALVHKIEALRLV
ncbi:phosphoglycerate dehydrogenase [Chryseolinea sp. Jin1]|uniref:Phosphoglycerate dehydrogenase n=2 Tax=Chryseolinea lacunae TaxID=2801331 RepID=A0ABS1KTS3_9BACT|nr:phosphoglycerate dehydrogenase [Chryseolinea lacunae]